ncbi:hypothetical protein ABIA33_006177 [Streptacidiphilus sp. MAP12-16]|uniref:luciferase domain-containing protein n=1 Tax=Streptacidiphilus sp. MAP12-16 TaxID=3156300 RepID=UPI003510FCB6
MTAARRAMEQLETWPDLTSAPASCGTGDALRAGANEIVHFHTGRDADLHLTSHAIERLHGELDHSTAVRLHPGSEWATVHLDCDTDADLLITLVSMALQAHETHRPASDRSSPASCNLGRVEIMHGEQGPADEEQQAVPGWIHVPRFARRRGRAQHRRAA